MSVVSPKNNFSEKTDQAFDKIWQNITLNIDQHTLIKFSSTLFKTLAIRGPNKIPFTNSFIITKLFNVPFPIGERMFAVIRPKNEENDDIIYQSQFNSLIETIYTSSFETKANFFFKLIDFDEDNIIHENEMQMFFTHLEYKNYQQKEKELKSIVHTFFTKNSDTNNQMTYDEYLNAITTNSDVVLLFYCLLCEKQLIDEEILTYYKTNILIDQEEENFFAKTKSINNSNHYPSLTTGGNKKFFSIIHNLNRSTTRDSRNDSVSIERKPSQLSFYPLKTGATNNSPMNKTLEFRYTRKYSPTKKLVDLLNKSGHFNLSLDFDSFNGVTKASNDLVEDEEIEDNLNDFESLNTFELDMHNYFDSLTSHILQKRSRKRKYGPNPSLSIIDYKIVKKETTIQSDNEDIIRGKHSFEMNPNNLNLQKLQLKQLATDFNAVEFDLVLFQKGIKTKLLILDNFLFVYYIQENKNKVKEKLTKIILLKNSFISVNSISVSSQEEKKPFSYIATVYFSEKKFIFCFFSETKRNKFVKIFNKINQINPNKTFKNEYIKHELLAQGHFGKIFLVEHKQTHKMCIEKLILKSASAAKEIEWEIYFSHFFSLFKHPNIINFHETYVTHEKAHLIMEYLPNGSLDKHLGIISRNLHIKFLTQAISAINFVHKYSIIHRDIKYENFIVNLKEKNIKLIDFGLSKVNFPTETSNESCGTVSYSAPEIIEEIPYNTSIDIWSFGVMLYLFQFNQLPTQTKAFNRQILKLEQQLFFEKKKEKTKGFWEENSIKKLINKTLIKESNKRISGEEIEKVLIEYKEHL